MRTIALAALLAFAVPVRAQRAADVPARPAPVVLSETPSTLGLGQLFNAETLKFSQSYEASYSTGGFGSLGLGVYTASLRWQPTQNLAGRVDLGVMHGLFGSDQLQSGLGLESPGDTRVFLRNAEIAYRPTENATLHLRVQQSPYGAYASPYGYGARSGFGAGLYGGTGMTGFSAGFDTGGADDLFFRDAE
ncbi:hypothetical protein [Rubrivirga marina]|uniref:Outer membrane protein beta-barrel domain-containing protein n=1 Tax=Rubrivirga marina TaxID=1196024 RepID=A0A271J4X5_9BACT|nr:hypothetical protein [Rubrivirga marina]PAP78562.1 hypothetical protein BSZ37_20095 [Rubrivirga marina]